MSCCTCAYSSDWWMCKNCKNYSNYRYWKNETSKLDDEDKSDW